MGQDTSVPSTLYVAGIAGRGSRLFKSVDSGATWRRLEGGLPPIEGGLQVLVIDPQTPATLYVGAFGRLFKSVDAGESWQPGGAPSDPGGIWPMAFVIDPRTSPTLYSGGARGVFKSLDGGMRWQPASRGLGGSGKHLAVDPLTPTTLYAGNREGVWKTTDGGANWIRRSTGLPTPKGYRASEPPEPFVEALAIAPGTPGTVYAGTRAGLFRSADGGASWTLVSDSWRDVGLMKTPKVERIPDSSVVSFVWVHPRIPTTVYAGESALLFRSADGGATWSRVGSLEVRGAPLAIDPGTPDAVYVLGSRLLRIRTR